MRTSTNQQWYRGTRLWWNVSNTNPLLGNAPRYLFCLPYLKNPAYWVSWLPRLWGMCEKACPVGMWEGRWETWKRELVEEKEEMFTNNFLRLTASLLPSHTSTQSSLSWNYRLGKTFVSLPSSGDMSQRLGQLPLVDRKGMGFLHWHIHAMYILKCPLHILTVVTLMDSIYLFI